MPAFDKPVQSRNTVQEVLRSAREASSANVFTEDPSNNGSGGNHHHAKDGESLAPNSASDNNVNPRPHHIPSMDQIMDDSNNEQQQGGDSNPISVPPSAEGKPNEKKNAVAAARARSNQRRPIVTLGEMVRRHDFRGLDKYAAPFVVESLDYRRGKDVASIALGGNPRHHQVAVPTFSRNPVRPKLVGDRYFFNNKNGEDQDENKKDQHRGYGFGASPSRSEPTPRHPGHGGGKQSAYFPVKGDFPQQPPADLAHLVPPPQDLARHLFSTINRSGLASIGISQDAARMLWPGFNDSSLVDRAFDVTLKKRIDTDEVANGAMRFDGFFPMLRCVAFMNNMNPLFKMMNRNLGDSITKKEFMAFAPQLRLKDPEAEFDEIDEEGSGEISIEQLCSFMAENPNRYADLEVNPLMALQNADKSLRKKNRLGKLNTKLKQPPASPIDLHGSVAAPASLAQSRTLLEEDIQNHERNPQPPIPSRAVSEDKTSARSAPVGQTKKNQQGKQQPHAPDAPQSFTPRHVRVAQRRAQRDAERLEKLRALAAASDDRLEELRRKKEQDEREKAEAARLAAIAAREANYALSMQLEEEDRLRLAEEAAELERRLRERELADQKRKEAFARGQAEREALLQAQAEKLAAERAKAEEEAKARREAALKAKREKEEAEREKKEAEEAEKRRQAEADRKRKEQLAADRKKKAAAAAKAREEKEAAEKAAREEAAKQRAADDLARKEKMDQEKAEKEAKRLADLEKRKKEAAEKKAKEMEEARQKAEEEAARKEKERQEAEEKKKAEEEAAAQQKAEKAAKDAVLGGSAIKIQSAARQRLARNKLNGLRKQRELDELEEERKAAELEAAENQRAEQEAADEAAASARKQAEEEAEKKLLEDEEAAKKKAEDDEIAQKKAAEEEAARKEAEAEAEAKKKADDEAAAAAAAEAEKKRLEDEAAAEAQKKADEEAAAAEAEKKRLEDEAAAKKQAEEEEKKKAEEEAAKQKAEEEAAAAAAAKAEKKRLEDEAAAEAKKKAEEEEAKKKAEEEAAAAKKKAEEEEAEKKRLEEEAAAAKKKAEEEEAEKKRLEEEERKAAEEQEAERKAAAEKAIADAKAKKEAEEAARKAAEEEARLAAEKAAAEKEEARKQAIRDRFAEPREKVQPHHLMMSTEKRFFADLFEYCSDFHEKPEEGVSEDEFKNKCISIKWPGHKAASAADRSWLYSTKNSKKRIAKHEELLSALQYVVYANNLQPLFENVDVNGTGTLDREEFEACASQFEIEDSDKAFVDMIKYINEHLKMSLDEASDAIPFDLYCFWLSREKPFFDVEVEVSEVNVPEGDGEKKGDNDLTDDDHSFSGSFEVAKSKRAWKTQPACDLDNLELPRDSSLLVDLWNHLDPKETTFMDQDTFVTACKELWPGFSNESAAKSAFSSVHHPENGDQIHRKRFSRALQYVVYANNLYSLFDEVDVDGNKRVDKAEFVAIAEQFELKDADAAFDEMDTKKTGHVSFEQFCEWVTNHKEEIENANSGDEEPDSPMETITKQE